MQAGCGHLGIVARATAGCKQKLLAGLVALVDGRETVMKVLRVAEWLAGSVIPHRDVLVLDVEPGLNLAPVHQLRRGFVEHNDLTVDATPKDRQADRALTQRADRRH